MIRHVRYYVIVDCASRTATAWKLGHGIVCFEGVSSLFAMTVYHPSQVVVRVDFGLLGQQRWNG